MSKGWWKARGEKKSRRARIHWPGYLDWLSPQQTDKNLTSHPSKIGPGSFSSWRSVVPPPPVPPPHPPVGQENTNFQQWYWTPKNRVAEFCVLANGQSSFLAKVWSGRTEVWKIAIHLVPSTSKQTSANGCFHIFLQFTDFSLFTYAYMCTVLPKRWRNHYSPLWNSFLVSSRLSTIFPPVPLILVFRFGN